MSITFPRMTNFLKSSIIVFLLSGENLAYALQSIFETGSGFKRRAPAKAVASQEANSSGFSIGHPPFKLNCLKDTFLSSFGVDLRKSASKENDSIPYHS
jgi:hypothetical protein